MADPTEMRNELLEKSQAAILRMTSPRWDLHLDAASPEERAQANQELVRLQQTRLKLENAQLADIRDKLIENEEDLKEGINQLSDELASLESVERVLGAVSSFVQMVGRILPVA